MFLIVEPALKSSGWVAVTNWRGGPGATGGSRFLPDRFLRCSGSLLLEGMMLEEVKGLDASGDLTGCCEIGDSRVGVECYSRHFANVQ
jgi:hypothetical protein